jgi:predicted dehydrogenase
MDTLDRMSTQILKIGMIGAGGIVRDRHAPGLSIIPDVTIASVCNSTPESAKRFTTDWAPDATVYESPEEVIDSDCDIIWIGTTPHMHCTLTCAALDAGKHVFCQARMAMNVAEAERMLAASEKHSYLVTALCPPPMGMKADLLMKQLLADNAIGTPHQLRLQSLASIYLDPSGPAHWRQRREISGIQILTLGIYVEVLERWFGRIASVCAQGNTIHTTRDGYSVEIPDFVDLLCTFESGVQATLNFSGVAAHAPGDRLEVYGSEGTIVYDFVTEEISLGNACDPTLTAVPLPPALQRDWSVEHDFVEAVRNPTAPRPRPNFAEGLDYMRVVEAANQSLSEGIRVAVDAS